MSQDIAEEVMVLDGDEVEVRFQDEQVMQSSRADKYVELKAVSTDIGISKENNVRNQLKSARRISKIWNLFTIVNKKSSTATCNVCGIAMSYRGTTSNLKKHLIRKHPENRDFTSSFRSLKPKYKLPLKKHKLSENAAAFKSLILNVVANEEPDHAVEIMGQEVEPSELHVVDEFCGFGERQIADSETITPKITSISGEQNNSASQTKYSLLPPKNSKINDRIEKMKNHRLLDLQLECLELKKYSMQMETLLLEQQLNLPRSIYTENLKGCNNVTRGTQTDVGGGNTKVFYITDHGSSREGTQHLFSFQD